MSIIYDALKKIKVSPSTANAPEPKKTQPSTNTYILYLIVIIIGIFVAKLFFGFFKPGAKVALVETKKISATQPQAQPQTQPVVPAPVAETKPQEEPLKEAVPAALSSPTFTLNGIFFSGEEGYALINNQICKVGDGVDGALVERITLEGVELKTFDGPIKLTNRNK